MPPEYPVWAALDVVYRALPGAVTRLYRLLSLHPGPDFGVEVALAALGGTESRTEAAALLSRLCRARLLEATGEPGAARYRFHPLVRLHATARAQLETGDGERVAAIHRIFDHFLATASYAESLLSSHHLPLHRSYASGTPPVVAPGINGDPERALRWLAAEQANLLAVARQARRLGMPALALTDQGVMYGAIPFYRACLAKSVKPIIGCEMYMKTGSMRTKETRHEQTI